MKKKRNEQYIFKYDKDALVEQIVDMIEGLEYPIDPRLLDHGNFSIKELRETKDDLIVVLNIEIRESHYPEEPHGEKLKKEAD